MHHTKEKKEYGVRKIEKVYDIFNKRVYRILKRLMKDNPEINIILNRINEYEHLYTSERELVVNYTPILIDQITRILFLIE